MVVSIHAIDVHLHWTYVNRVELLLHVVGSEEVGDTSQLQKEVVLETEDGGRADNGGLREQAASDLFRSALNSSLASQLIEADNLQTLVR